jgi:hypothetical protein
VQMPSRKCDRPMMSTSSLAGVSRAMESKSTVRTRVRLYRLRSVKRTKRELSLICSNWPTAKAKAMCDGLRRKKLSRMSQIRTWNCCKTHLGRQYRCKACTRSSPAASSQSTAKTLKRQPKLASWAVCGRTIT